MHLPVVHASACDVVAACTYCDKIETLEPMQYLNASACDAMGHARMYLPVVYASACDVMG